MAVPLRAEREQVLGFRLASHNLSRRLPPGSLLAAAACGIQNTPPGSATLALNARVLEVKAEAVDAALETSRTILQVRGPRAAPYVFPTADLRVFTTGLLPEDEESLRFFLQGGCPALDRVGISATRVVDLAGAELLEALDGRVLTFGELSAELTERVARHLSPRELVPWRSPSWYGPNQCLGEAIVHFALYAVALRGLFCFAPRRGNEACFVRIDQWVGEPPREVPAEAARAELVRRYLRCYGPTTAGHFGEWAGISREAATRSWRLVESELVEVVFGGRRGWLHEGDVADFLSPPESTDVRLLPPHDPYLSQRDRGTLLPDRAVQRRVWRSVGNPGVVLVGGRVAGTWRAQKKGKRLVIAVEPMEALRAEDRSEIEAEAGLVARLRGCAAAVVAFGGWDGEAGPGWAG